MGATNIDIITGKEETNESKPSFSYEYNSSPSLPNENVTQKVIRHRIIKKIVMVDGKPVESETIESPIESDQRDTYSKEKENFENIKSNEKIVRKRIIKRIVMEDGKPTETEQIIEDPEVTEESTEIGIDQPDTVQRVIRKKII